MSLSGYKWYRTMSLGLLHFTGTTVILKMFELSDILELMSTRKVIFTASQVFSSQVFIKMILTKSLHHLRRSSFLSLTAVTVHSITRSLSVTAAIYKNTEARRCHCTLHLEAVQATMAGKQHEIKKADSVQKLCLTGH